VGIDLVSGSADFVQIRWCTLVESQSVNEFSFRRGSHGLLAVAAVDGKAGLIEQFLDTLGDVVGRTP